MRYLVWLWLETDQMGGSCWLGLFEGMQASVDASGIHSVPVRGLEPCPARFQKSSFGLVQGQIVMLEQTQVWVQEVWEQFAPSHIKAQIHTKLSPQCQLHAGPVDNKRHHHHMPGTHILLTQHKLRKSFTMVPASSLSSKSGHSAKSRVER